MNDYHRTQVQSIIEVYPFQFLVGTSVTRKFSLMIFVFLALTANLKTDRIVWWWAEVGLVLFIVSNIIYLLMVAMDIENNFFVDNYELF